MQSHICRIYLTFPRCGFSNVSSNRPPERMQSNTGCICLAFIHCAFSNVSSGCLPDRMQSHIGCICLTFPHCASLNVSSNCTPVRTQTLSVFFLRIFAFAPFQPRSWVLRFCSIAIVFWSAPLLLCDHCPAAPVYFVKSSLFTNPKLRLVRNMKAENDKSKWNICLLQKLRSGGG